MQHVSQEACAAFVGLDWADAPHDVCVHAAGTERRACGIREPSPEAIDGWAHTLRTRCNGQPGAVCLALHKGPMVSARRHDDCLVRLPVTPLTLATYRAACTHSRAN